MRFQKRSRGYLAAVFLLIWSVCTGCGAKEAKTMDDFTALAKELGYTISDCTEQFADYGHIDQAVLAQSPDGKYQVEFYDLDSEESACVFYQENYEILSEREEDAVSHVSSGTDSAQNYEITAKAGFGCVTRVGETCFYAVVDKEYADEVKSFKKELGY